MRRELDRRVGNDSSHRCRVAPPEGKEALLGVRVTHECHRRSERVGDIFVNLEVDLGPIQRGNRRFGQGTGDGSGNQTSDDYLSIVQSMVVGIRDVTTATTRNTTATGTGTTAAAT